jgi:hypothetical protein
MGVWGRGMKGFFCYDGGRYEHSTLEMKYFSNRPNSVKNVPWSPVTLGVRYSGTLPYKTYLGIKRKFIESECHGQADHVKK